MASRLTEKLLADIERYLKSEMTGIELTMFENNLKEDAELRSELRLQIELSEAMGNEGDYSLFKQKLNREEIDKLKSKLRSKEYQDLSANIRNAEEVYFSEQSPSRSFKKYYRYFAIAGMIILFFGIYFSQMNTSYNSYYEANVDWTELPSFVEKGQQKDAFAKGEIAFKKEDYKAAAEQFAIVETSYDLYTNSLIYLGASYDKLDQNDNAIAAFQKLAAVDESYESSQGYWYEAMMHLKMNNKEKAITALQKSVEKETNFKYQEAKVLLRKLD
jgi:hypothetical protein